MSTNAGSLVDSVKQLIADKQYDGVLLLFGPEKEENISTIKFAAADLVELLLVHLNDENYKNNLALYTCCEEVMKLVATHANAEEVLFEMLQIVEESQSENVFTTALKSLQICLLRLKTDKSRALEWTLNSIVNRITDLKIPGYLVSGYGQRQEKLLEQDDDVLKVLANYITLALFYEPLLEDVLKDKDNDVNGCKKNNRRNVLCCFFLQLLGKPLCYLDLTTNERKTNTYTMQCATSLVKAATKILEDPFYLLSLVEDKVSSKSRGGGGEIDEIYLDNIFKMEEKLPIESMGIFYYLLIVEGIGWESAPKVYCPVYIFESCLYLVTDFLTRKAPLLQWRGLLLCHKTLDNMGTLQIPDKSLLEPIHQKFCRVLSEIIGYSGVKRNRQSGIVLLKKYILRFSDESICVILESLIMNLNHAGLQGYLSTIYKDLVAEKLASERELPASYSGPRFADFLLKHICVLQNGVETDLIQNADRIVPALNAVRFFALTDEKNATGFWDLCKKIEKSFLDPLRMAINMSVAHYEVEMNAVKDNKGSNKNYEKMAEMLSISALNGSAATLALDPSKRLEVLKQALTTFDLLKCLLARATECVEKRNKKKYFNNLLQPTSTSSVLTAFFHTTRHPVVHTPAHQQSSSHKLTKPCCTRYTSFRRNLATGLHSTGQSTKIDEFRAREEKREEEFAKQESESPPDDKEQDDPKRAKANAVRINILNEALKHVAIEGWTRQAIIRGAEEAGYPSEVHGMFPDGGYELVSHFIAKCNDALLKHLQAETNNGQKEISDPLAFLISAVKFRLQMVEPYISHWPQAMALIALPPNVPTSLAQVLTMVDDMCYYSGDRSVDFGWYTRRVGLATIYKMVEVYMLQDSSADHHETWAFLKNRMEEAAQIQLVLSQTGDMTHNFQRSFNSAFVTARNILGLNYDRR